MFKNIHKHHVSATALALLGCYGALLSAQPARELAEPTPELEPQETGSSVRATPAITPPPNTGASNSVLSDLSARLGDLEAQLDMQAKATTETPAPTPAAAAGPEPALADWMLAAIRGEEWDREHTQKVEAELSATLEQVPELHAQELECGRRFCRALLIDRRGADVTVQPLFGAPPFDGEGFTTIGQGGKAEVYFTRAGQSLDALRQEAHL